MKNIEKCLKILDKTKDINRSIEELTEMKPYINSSSDWSDFFRIGNDLKIFKYFSLPSTEEDYSPYQENSYKTLTEQKQFSKIKPILDYNGIFLSARINILLNYFESYIKNKQLEFDF